MLNGKNKPNLTWLLSVCIVQRLGVRMSLITQYCKRMIFHARGSVIGVLKHRGHRLRTGRSSTVGK